MYSIPKYLLRNANYAFHIRYDKIEASQNKAKMDGNDDLKNPRLYYAGAFFLELENPP
jgi:hypothetical protein